MAADGAIASSPRRRAEVCLLNPELPLVIWGRDYRSCPQTDTRQARKMTPVSQDRSLGPQLCEQLGFALRGNTGAELGLSLGGQSAEPDKSVGCG